MKTDKIRAILKYLLGNKSYKRLVKFYSNSSQLISLVKNIYQDAALYYKHSMVFKDDTYNKTESRIILHYHSIEKGFLHENFRYKFGKWRIVELIELLKYSHIVEKNKKTQIAAAYLAMVKYYEIHQLNSVDISEFYLQDDFHLFKSLVTLDIGTIKENKRNDFFKNNKNDFYDFSKSRSSVRNFTKQHIPFEMIDKVIEIAKTAPSVCNRQPNKVYYVENKGIIENIFEIQGGLTGYSDDVSQLLVLVSDRNYFYSVGERNQLYIDGGLFLMNLLYGLHYYKIGACPAHWGLNFEHDKKIQKLLNLKDSEKVICLIPIGIPKESFYTTLSLRRANNEILKVIDK